MVKVSFNSALAQKDAAKKEDGEKEGGGSSQVLISPADAKVRRPRGPGNASGQREAMGDALPESLDLMLPPPRRAQVGVGKGLRAGRPSLSRERCAEWGWAGRGPLVPVSLGPRLVLFCFGGCCGVFAPS